MNRNRGLGVLACVAAVVWPAAAPAAAAAPAQHCVLNLDDGRSACFGTFTAAEVFASDGAITDAPADLATARAEFRPQGDIKQGTFFDDRDYGGSSYTIVGDGLCDGSDGVINYQADFPDDWKNRVSSVQPWGSCKIWLYPEPGLNGDRDGPFTENTAFIGDFMNDRAQSVGFS